MSLPARAPRTLIWERRTRRPSLAFSPSNSAVTTVLSATMDPTVAKKELVPLQRVHFPKRQGVQPPVRLHDVFRLDFGPEFRSRGIVAYEPPKTGPI